MTIMEDKSVPEILMYLLGIFGGAYVIWLIFLNWYSKRKNDRRMLDRRAKDRRHEKRVGPERRQQQRRDEED
jgi:threonine/homoserine/homoserine lactone efflux protein